MVVPSRRAGAPSRGSSTATVAALGTAYGGWRIIKTLGFELTELNPPQGFAAEVAGATVIQV